MYEEIAQRLLKSGLGAVVSEVTGGVIQDSDISLFKKLREQNKGDVAKSALTKLAGKTASQFTFGLVTTKDIENFKQTRSLKDTLLKKNITRLAIGGAAASVCPFLDSPVGDLVEEFLPQITAEDILNKVKQFREAPGSNKEKLGQALAAGKQNLIQSIKGLTAKMMQAPSMAGIAAAAEPAQPTRPSRTSGTAPAESGPGTPLDAARPITPAAPLTPQQIQAQYQQTRRKARKDRQAGMYGSGNWEEGAEPQAEAASDAAATGDRTVGREPLPSGRVPGAPTAGPAPGPPLGQEGMPEDDIKHQLTSQQKKDRGEKHHQIMKDLPSAIASGAVDNLGQIPSAAGMKDENNKNLDLDQNLTDHTGANNDNEALDKSEKELDAIEQQEAKQPEQKGKASDPQTKKNKYNQGARKAKLAAGLQKIVKKHQTTNWFILTAMAAFRDLISWVEFGILVIIFAPIKLLCFLAKKVMLAGKETTTDNAVAWTSAIFDSVPILDYLPSSLAEIARLYGSSKAKMVKAQKQLDRIQKKKKKRSMIGTAKAA